MKLKGHPHAVWLLRRASTANPTDEMKKRQAQIMSRGLPKQTPITDVRHIVMVTSGKGGVGKSTISANLAVGLAMELGEKKVGLLDADVYGPTIPVMMNLDGSPDVDKDNKMLPLVNYGVKCMSMGFLVPGGGPVVWRGLMVMQAIQDLTRNVRWGPLDVLVVDTPPGTGDTHLSLAQTLPVSGALVVTSSQAVAINAARKGAQMLQKVQVPIIGVVTNMSSFACPNCATKSDLFGTGTGSQKLAEELGVQVVADITLNPKIGELSDSGQPIVISHPDTEQAQQYRSLVKQVLNFLQLR